MSALTAPREVTGLVPAMGKNPIKRWQGKDGRSYATFAEAEATFTGIPPPQPPPPFDRDTALMYAVFNGYALSTARKHLKEGLLLRGQEMDPYEEAGFIHRVMRENLPEGSLWSVEGHIRHRYFGVLVAVPDEVSEEFLEQRFDDVRDKLSSVKSIDSLELLTLSEAHSTCGRYIDAKGQEVLLG